MANPKKRRLIASSVGKRGMIRIGLLSALGLAGAWFAFALAISGVTRIKNPQVALTFMPNESTALAARADQLYFASPEKPPKAAKTLAVAALRQQAINAKALRLLGYVADGQGDTAKAEALVRAAAALSRREVGAQLWLIEANARKDDTKQALFHYDIALRTKTDAQTLLFPRLLAAIEDREIRTGLKPYIRANRGWPANFIYYAIVNSKNLPVLVDLLVESGGLADQKIANSHELHLLARLVAEKYFADARRLYLQMDNAPAARLTSANFASSDRDARFGPMGWQMLEDPDAGGGFTGKSNERKISLSVFANPATTRPVASKLLYIRPGYYIFSSKLTSLDRGDGGFLRWLLRCPSEKTGKAVLTVDTISITVRQQFAIPADCPVQALDLVVSGGKGQTGLEAIIADVSIAP
jgi:tetratricopeptide (TPR) repeat protein